MSASAPTSRPASISLEAREVTCPACKGPSRYASDNPYRPFCGARCKNADLGAWANEEFKLASPPIQDADPDSPALLQ